MSGRPCSACSDARRPELLAELKPAEGQDAHSLAEQLKRAKAEQVSIQVLPLDALLDSKVSPHEALRRLVEDGYLTQDEADEAMRRKGETEPRLKALPSGKQAEGEA